MQGKMANEVVLAVDAGNLFWLKGVFATRGFPTVGTVGGHSVSIAWLLVQRADPRSGFLVTSMPSIRAQAR